MNSAALTRETSPAAVHQDVQPGVLRQFWASTVAVVGALLSVRHHMQQFDQTQRLLREASRLKETNPERSAALRAKAFDLLD